MAAGGAGGRGVAVRGAIMEIDNPARHGRPPFVMLGGAWRAKVVMDTDIPIAFAIACVSGSASAPLSLSASFMGKMSYEFCCSNLKAVIKTNFICFSFRTPPTGDPSYLLSLPWPAPAPSLFNTGQQIKTISQANVVEANQKSCVFKFDATHNFGNKSKAANLLNLIKTKKYLAKPIEML